jgi:hypothetical protein
VNLAAFDVIQAPATTGRSDIKTLNWHGRHCNSTAVPRSRLPAEQLAPEKYIKPDPISQSSELIESIKNANRTAPAEKLIRQIQKIQEEAHANSP